MTAMSSEAAGIDFVNAARGKKGLRTRRAERAWRRSVPLGPLLCRRLQWRFGIVPNTSPKN